MFGVASCVDDDDVAASPQDHFVEAKILEMSPVREIHVGMVGISESKCFCQQGKQGEAWTTHLVGLLAFPLCASLRDRLLLSGFTRISEPPAKPDVE